MVVVPMGGRYKGVATLRSSFARPLGILRLPPHFREVRLYLAALVAECDFLYLRSLLGNVRQPMTESIMLIFKAGAIVIR